MKIAFVMGFYESVKTALNEHYPERVYRDRLIWIPPGKGSLTTFKGRFYDVVRTAEGILVCFGRNESQSALDDHIRGIIAIAQGQRDTLIRFEPFGNLYDAHPVLALVKNFGLETQPQIAPNQIRKKVPGGKILCVSLAGKTSVLTALLRVGVTPHAIDQCFEEEIVEGARNSNLNSHFRSKASGYSCMLYAWEGARTISPEAKTGFSVKCLEARSAAQVAELFKKWITEGV